MKNKLDNIIITTVLHSPNRRLSESKISPLRLISYPQDQTHRTPVTSRHKEHSLVLLTKYDLLDEIFDAVSKIISAFSFTLHICWVSRRHKHVQDFQAPDAIQILSVMNRTSLRCVQVLLFTKQDFHSFQTCARITLRITPRTSSWQCLPRCLCTVTHSPSRRETSMRNGESPPQSWKHHSTAKSHDPYHPRSLRTRQLRKNYSSFFIFDQNSLVFVGPKHPVCFVMSKKLFEVFCHVHGLYVIVLQYLSYFVDDELWSSTVHSPRPTCTRRTCRIPSVPWLWFLLVSPVDS